MPTQTYTNEQFWKLYPKLPQELKDALWAQETGDYIYEICQRYEITDKLTEIAQLVGQVLVGLAMPTDFSGGLEKLGVDSETAEKVSREINRFIFYPVRPALEQLHRMEIEVSAKVVAPQPPSALKETRAEGQEEGPGEPDAYREPIE